MIKLSFPKPLFPTGAEGCKEMKLHSITVQSIKRRKAKTSFLALGMILSVGSVVTLINIGNNVNKSIAANLDEFGANIIVTPRTDDVNLNYVGINITGSSYQDNELTINDAQKIKQIKNSKNISILAPKLLNVETTEKGKVIVSGVNFNEEKRLKKWWTINGSYPGTKDEIIVGNEIAKRLILKKGDHLKIKDKDYVVTGILEETGSQDDNMIFMDLTEAGVIFNKQNKVSFIEVAALCYDCPMEEIVAQTSEKLPGAKVTPIKQAIESKMKAIHSFENFAYAISIVILLISVLIVFVNVNASVNERTKEIGILKSIGFRDSHILKVIIYEVGLISIASGIAGYLLSLSASSIITPFLTMDNYSGGGFNYSYLPLAVGLSMLVGILAGIYPAIRATKLDPTVAFRAI